MCGGNAPVGVDDEYRDLTTTLGRELFRYTINVSTFD